MSWKDNEFNLKPTWTLTQLFYARLLNIKCLDIILLHDPKATLSSGAVSTSVVMLFHDMRSLVHAISSSDDSLPWHSVKLSDSSPVVSLCFFYNLFCLLSIYFLTFPFLKCVMNFYVCLPNYNYGIFLFSFTCFRMPSLIILSVHYTCNIFL